MYSVIVGTPTNKYLEIQQSGNRGQILLQEKYLLKSFTKACFICYTKPVKNMLNFLMDEWHQKVN